MDVCRASGNCLPLLFSTAGLAEMRVCVVRGLMVVITVMIIFALSMYVLPTEAHSAGK